MVKSELVGDFTQIKLLPKFKCKRIWEIDFLRGFCIVLMIFDHLALLLGDFFGPGWFGPDMAGEGFGPELCRLCEYYYYESDLRRIGHQVVLFIFFSVSGISCTFSRSNAKRGFQLAVIALIYSLCSYAAQEGLGIAGVLVVFGVLDFYAVCILLYALIDFIARKNRLATALASGAIILLTLLLYFLYTPPENTPLFFAIVFPPVDFWGNESLFYSAAAFSPGDLFTLIPYASFFFFGTMVGPYLYANRVTHLPILDHAWHRPFNFVGRHALLFYIVHVVALTVLLMLISVIFITPGDWILF